MRLVPRLSPEQLDVASPAELRAYEHALQVELALSSPLDYAERVTKETQRMRHSVLLNRLIVQAIRGQLLHPVTGLPVRKIAVSMPPRHGKSWLISDHTPAWVITRYADLGFRVGLAGYEADFAASWGFKAREHVLDHEDFFPHAKVDRRSRAANAWDLLPMEPGGPRAGMNTAGVGGPFTGKGFHLIVIDDPIKNGEEAMSQTIRDKHEDWYWSTANTRLEPLLWDPVLQEFIGGVTILVNTRWHEDDLMGRVLKGESDKWYHLNLKALADESGDPLGRQPGEALAPERYTAADLAEIRDSPKGRYWFNAMYQGTPQIEGGGLFKSASFQFWRPTQVGDAVELRPREGHPILVPRRELIRFSTVDLAVTDKQTSDYSVMSTWDVTPDRRALLVDRRRRRVEAADHDEFIKTAYRDLAPRWIGVEKTAYHLGLIKRLIRDGIPIRELTPDKDKVARAIPAGILVDNGRFFWPEGAVWLEEWTSELLAFPNSTNDDQVDTLSYAAVELSTGALSNPAGDKPHPEDRSADARRQRHLQALDGRRKRRPTNPVMGRW